jgi:hypothetical protein
MFDNDQRKIEQELELKFLPSGGSFFDEKTCLKLQNGTIDPIETFRIFDGEIWKFQNPVSGKHYIIGVDTAPEFGEDKSTITIWDYESLTQVWEYQTKCKVLDFIKQLRYISKGSVIVMPEFENKEFGQKILFDYLVNFV